MNSREAKTAIHQRAREIAERLLGPPAKSNGEEHVWCTPWRADKNPSLNINFAKPSGQWIDRATNEGGDVFDLVARVRGLDVRTQFPQVLAAAGELCGVQVNGANGAHAAALRAPAPPPAPPVQYCSLDPLESPDGLPEGYAYQQAVELPPAPPAPPAPSVGPTPAVDDLAARYGLQWSDFAAAGCTIERGYRGLSIVYPVTTADGGTVRKCKSVSRNAAGKRDSWGDKGSAFQRGLFVPIRDARAAAGMPLVLAEGEEKALAAIKAGLPACSPANGADGLSEDAAAMIAGWASEWNSPAVVIAFDADDAGRKGALKSAGLLLAAGVPLEKIRSIAWPENSPKGYDVTDHLVQHGADALLQLLGEAPQADVPGREQASWEVRTLAHARAATVARTYLIEGLIPAGLHEEHGGTMACPPHRCRPRRAWVQGKEARGRALVQCRSRHIIA